jgi:hypothetical protein
MNPIVNDELKDDYDKLPEALKLVYTRQEYLWLSDLQKAKLIERETEPDVEL